MYEHKNSKIQSLFSIGRYEHLKKSEAKDRDDFYKNRVFITEMKSDVEEIKYIQIYKRVRRVKFSGTFPLKKL
jgi:hypothetical protein